MAEDKRWGLGIRVGKSYEALAQQSGKFIGVQSRRGTGKTRGILSLIIARAIAYPGTHWLLARSTRTRLSDTVLRTLEEQVLPLFSIPVPSGSRFNRSEYQIGNGSVLVPQGLDDQTRSQSAEYSGIYVAEGVEIDKQDDVLALAGTLREASIVPPGMPALVKQCLVDFNPGAPGHWINHICEPVAKGLGSIQTRQEYERLLAHNRQPPPAGKWKRIVTSWADNPAYFDPITFEYTPAGREYLETLNELRGHMRRRWRDDEWVSAEGAVFPEYDPEVHLCDDFDPDSDWPQCLGYDNGYAHPTGILWMCLSPDGGIYVYDEVHQGGLSVETHCAEIISRNQRDGRNVLRMFADPMGFFSNTSAGSCFRQAKAMGLKFVPWPRTKSAEVNQRVDVVRQLLLNTILKEEGKLGEGTPYLMICRRCKGLQSNLSTWAYKKMASGELPAGDDAFVDSDNDCSDVLLGVISSNFLQRMYGNTEVQTLESEVSPRDANRRGLGPNSYEE